VAPSVPRIYPACEPVRLRQDSPFEREDDTMQRSNGIARLQRTAWRRGLRVALVAAALVASGNAVPSSSWTLNAQTQRLAREDLVKKLTGKKIRLDKPGPSEERSDQLRPSNSQVALTRAVPFQPVVRMS
jgi:hypothetical protein